MITSWKSQQGGGEYSLQFETDNKELYLFIEKAAKEAVDITKALKKISTKDFEMLTDLISRYGLDFIVRAYYAPTDEELIPDDKED